ncbi:MAG: potassium-transporting ATPase subunit KdpC [Candidatus Riflebacteria bacterium]|nr:potassium-transporting ATPase subunit KdpC [Candidatus Riflebacteria bacterium]
MNSNSEKISIFNQLITSTRVVLTTMIVCSGLYTLLILGIGQMVVPHTANGSLIFDECGKIIGSELIAQTFTSPKYFWSRPSSTDYNASASGGSNWSPTNNKIRERAEKIIGKMNNCKVTNDKMQLIPADLVTSSGSGIDPHITLQAAKYQIERVAEARGLSVGSVQAILETNAGKISGYLFSEPIVNVLIVNRELDKLRK